MILSNVNVYMNYIHRQGRIVHLRSKDTLIALNGLTSNISVCLNNPLTLNDDEYFVISVTSFTCPMSFYSLDSNNNVVYVTESDEDGGNPQTKHSFTIGTGNYNIRDLSTLLQTALNTNTNYSIVYTVSYNKNTNKITISTTTENKKAVFDFTQNYTVRAIFGLTNNTHTMTTTTALTSDSVCNINNHDVIYIRSNLVSGFSIDSSNNMCNTDILQKVELRSGMNEYIFLYNSSTSIIYQSAISNIELKLTDEDGNLINLNGCHWTISLLVNYIKREELYDSKKRVEDIQQQEEKQQFIELLQGINDKLTK